MSKLSFKYGTMNSGKTATLIMDAYNSKQGGKSILIFKPRKDSRTKSHLYSRAIKAKEKAVVISDEIQCLQSMCTECMNVALVNARFVDGEIQSEGEKILIGSENHYKALCRNCYYTKMFKKRYKKEW